jgi:aspartyl-tRNA(Asn)/glutamyl-tRNA(Gln) amidotransferase subunit A
MTQTSVRDALESALAASTTPVARHVFTALMPESARGEADAADARRKAGVSLGPLDGMIVSVKDLFDIAGAPTAAGSKMRKAAPPATADAPAVARIRRAGAVLIGRTNMSEFAYSGLGLNPHYGTPGNAAAPDRAPGGSTSGGAVSVGLGLAHLTLGTDTGGSTRIPAAFNGIVGFKPTSTRIPKDGCFPLSHSLDSIGPLGRNAAECAAADAIMAGEEPLPLADFPLAGLRVAVPRGVLFENTESEVERAFEASLKTLAKQGARIIEIDIEALIAEMRAALAIGPIAACEAAQIHAAALETCPGEFDRRVLARIRLGQPVPAWAYIEAVRRREALKPALAARLADFDVLAMPTVAIQAPLIAPLEADDALFNSVNLLALRNTSLSNFFDLPALSLPLPVDGLPVGLMLVGAPYSDRRVFAIGQSVETALKAG